MDVLDTTAPFKPMDSATARSAGSSAPACSAVPNTVIAFLLGEGPLDGVWFGEKHPTERGNFWWRKHLRLNSMIDATSHEHVGGATK